MEHAWLKAFHVAAVATWIGGMLVASLTVAIHATSPGPRQPGDTRTIEAMRRWDRLATVPAMLLAWALGIAMAMRAGWFSSPWLMVKLVLVFGLSALHGILSGTLRRMAGDPESRPSAFLRHAAPAVVAVVVVVAILAFVKPFRP